MKRCAVIVGVDSTGGLPVLDAAAKGAESFDRWARSQGIVTRLLTDARSQEVTLDAVKMAVKNFLGESIYEQLIVYFAGHGMLKAADAELWLLSGAPDDPYEAVNLPLSVSYARNTPLKHVVMISDACRSVPDNVQQFGVIGKSIFPNLQPLQRRPRVDLMFATAPGDPSYEVPVSDAVDSYQGVYSSVLLAGLRGKDPTVPEEHEGSWYVFTRAIDSYLLREVPKAAGRVKLTLRQIPETRPESSPPLYLATVKGPTSRLSSLVVPPDSGGSGSAPGDSSLHQRAPTLDAQVSEARIALDATVSHLRPNRVRERMRHMLGIRGRLAFETRIGFTVVGIGLRRAQAIGQEVDVFEEDDAMHVRLYGEQPTSTLLVFENGNATILAAWPGYIGTVVVEDGKVTTVNYTPSAGSDIFVEYENKQVELDHRRAFVASMANDGRFQLNPDNAVEDARYLRKMKRIDPTLGIYASYAYAQAGAVEPIHSVLKAMKRDLGAVPADVALLAGRLEAGDLMSGAVVPICPMMTEGWLRLDEAWDELPPSLANIGRFLHPALWTTFHASVTEELVEIFEHWSLQ